MVLVPGCSCQKFGLLEEVRVWGGKDGAFILGCIAFEMPMHMQKEITRTIVHSGAQKRDLGWR